MTVTNRLNLPKPFVDALQLDRHNEKGCLSATTLNKGVKEIILTERHWDEMPVEVLESIWTIWGSAVHSIFEKFAKKEDGFESEVQYSVDMGSHTITGKVDCYDTKEKVLYDWKTCSSWKIKMSDFTDWKRQGSIYAYLMKRNDVEVKKVRFVALIKDFSQTEAQRNRDYPQSPVYVYEFDVTDGLIKTTEEFLVKKEKEVTGAEVMADDDIPECSFEERWATEGKYAVMKKDVKKAVKLFDNEKEAEEFAKVRLNHSVVKRPEVNRKCDGYCPCAHYCHFYKENHKGEEL